MLGSFAWKTRYSVLAVLFATNILCFVDRMVMPVAIPFIARDFNLTPVAMGLVMSAFYLSYSACQIPGGLLADIFGVRKVATLAMLWWTACTALTGAVTSFTQMVAVRFLFGLGEGVYPACSFKTVAVWFPKRERATANAIKMAASNLGVAISPLIVVWIMSYWGWREVFFVLLAPGLIVTALLWMLVPDRPAESHRVSPKELAEIEEDEDAGAAGAIERPTFRRILREPNILRYFLALFAYDVAFWGFTTWLPTYLVKARGFSMIEMGVAASLPAFAGAVGSVSGGWISDRYFSHNRKIPIIVVMLFSAILLWSTYAAQSTAMLIVCQTLAGLTLNIFFTSFWALPMNSVPRNMMGVASGFINMAGQIAAFVSPLSIGYLVQAMGGDFLFAFVLIVGSLLVSLAIILTIPAAVKVAPIEGRR